jgi:predicted ester cyclase
VGTVDARGGAGGWRMSTERNKVIARRWHEAWGTDLLRGAYLECLDPEFRALFFGQGWVDRATYIRRDQELLKGFREVRVRVEDAIAERDTVMCRMTWSGEQNGTADWLQPTGKRFEIQGFALDRFRDGRVIEHIPLFDQLGLLQQLGVLETVQ